MTAKPTTQQETTVAHHARSLSRRYTSPHPRLTRVVPGERGTESVVQHPYPDCQPHARFPHCSSDSDSHAFPSVCLDS